MGKKKIKRRVVTTYRTVTVSRTAPTKKKGSSVMALLSKDRFLDALKDAGKRTKLSGIYRLKGFD